MFAYLSWLMSLVSLQGNKFGIPQVSIMSVDLWSDPFSWIYYKACSFFSHEVQVLTPHHLFSGHIPVCSSILQRLTITYRVWRAAVELLWGAALCHKQKWRYVLCRNTGMPVMSLCSMHTNGAVLHSLTGWLSQWQDVHVVSIKIEVSVNCQPAFVTTSVP